MKKNLLLNIANLICILLCIFVVIIFLITTAALIHWHFNPEFYVDYALVDNHFQPNNFFAYTIKSSWTIGDEKEYNPFTLDKITAPSLYLMYLQLSAMNLLMVSILREFLNIIKSVRMVHSFRISNIDSFRKIGKYLFIFFVLSSFHIVIAEQGSFFGFYLHLTPLILMLIAFILGEVFKEGNSLLEENQLTV